MDLSNNNRVALATLLLTSLATAQLSVTPISSVQNAPRSVVMVQNPIGNYAICSLTNQSTQVPVISQFYTVLATLLFFATDAHLRLIRLLADSFHLMPFGTALPRGALAEVMRWSGDLLGLAVLLSLPIIIALLIVNLAFAFMSRAAPQLNIFSIGFPVTLLCGVLLLMLSATSIAGNVAQTLDAGFSAAYRLLAPR